jgi:hypothetical protein
MDNEIKNTEESENKIKKDNSWLILGIITITAIAFWDTVFIYPVKIFVVILHEISHGLAALLTGGKIISIQIDPGIGGFCQFSKPSGFFSDIFVASAGYLGSILWGSLILIIACRTKFDKTVSFLIGIFIFLITLFFIRNTFGFIFCTLFSAIMIFSSLKLSEEINDFILRFLGLTSCLYAIIDIKEDLISRTVQGSDAFTIAKMLGIGQLSIVIGIIWALIAIIVIYFTLKLCLIRSDVNNNLTDETD